jgi:hypothetical protein
MALPRALACFSVLTALACGDGGSASSSDAGSDAASTESTFDEPRCAAYVDRQLAACGEAAEQRDTNLTVCLREAEVYASVGCGEAYGVWLTCAAEASNWECRTGPSGCSASENGYYSCANEQKRVTGCTPHGRVDDHCTGDTPYKFICLTNTAPKEGCTLYDDSELFSFCCG